ncbi:class II fructose-bisphosphate aldolase [Candidatus Uhrbacteria bacterium]|nr:class II fructose-bisphosphate aldolase [Candidatus Uhrbacteria bacterium]
MLIPAKSLLVKARAKKYAVPAFNINNLETLQAVMSAAVSMKSPVIIQTSEGAIEYAGMDYLIALVRVAAQTKLPIVLHLDHGKDLKLIKRAIDSGYTSVMFDGSSEAYADNVRNTKLVVKWARTKKISVEAEIGVLAGIEDKVSVVERGATMTDPKQALEFATKTECDSLAVAIGTSHGAFKFAEKNHPHLDLPRLEAIAQLVKIPIVLHGASGVREDVLKIAVHYGAKLGEARGILDQDIKAAIFRGVAKVNIDTDLRLAFTAGVREAVADSPSVIDPRKLLMPARLLMTEIAKQKMKLFGSAGKA